MNRRAFVTGLGSLLGAPRAAEAQRTGKVYRIGYLDPTSATPVPRWTEAFRQALRELGWVEGQNIVIDYRFAEGRFDRLPDLAAELARSEVDVIVAVVTQASLAAQKATRQIPIVMVGVADPVGVGLVKSLARPGGNISGTSSVAAEAIGKQLELLKETVPNLSQLGVLWNPTNEVFQALELKEVRAAARAKGVHVQLLAARSPEDIGAAFQAMTARIDALFVLAGALLTLSPKTVADLASKRHLPSMGGTSSYVEAGGLLGYGPSYLDLARRSAYFVDKILKGAKPADLPVEQPTKFDLVINLKTAKALGLTIPPSLLLRADQVIE